jgi:hypothetical protein
VLSLASWWLGAVAGASLERRLGEPISAGTMHFLAFGLSLLAASDAR